MSETDISKYGQIKPKLHAWLEVFWWFWVNQPFKAAGTWRLNVKGFQVVINRLFLFFKTDAQVVEMHFLIVSLST